MDTFWTAKVRFLQKVDRGLLPYSRAPHPTAVAFCPANSSLEATEVDGIHTGEKRERSTWGEDNRETSELVLDIW